ncbi:MAG: hypothetical protein K0S65_3937 [Labilithrix sp.]|nr:hypothetical protein [Labilithrix sp.]
MSKCDATLKECYGSDYKNGSFGGACNDFVSCVNACECGDIECFGNCPEPSSACITCGEKLDTCITQQCPEPECMNDGGGEGTKCADLADCCAAMEDEDERSACEQALEVAGGNDVTCGALYDSLCSGG